MLINVKSSGIPLTDAIKSYFQEKISSLEKIVTHSGEVSADAQVVKLSAHHHKGEMYKAEVNMHVSGGLVRAEAQSEDLYAAIDAVKDELSEKLKSKKEKRESLFLRGSRLAKRILRRE